MQGELHDSLEGEGNLRKMAVELDDSGCVQYQFSTADILDPQPQIQLNDRVGQHIRLEFTGAIHCTVSGSRIRKTYMDGMGFKAFQESPLGLPSILRPELSRIHEGVALRDHAWEMEHHMQPHIVYLSYTSGIKVGVTRATQIPQRWIDQGAAAAVVLCRTPYRALAGQIEVDLKSEFSDRTLWRSMLTLGHRTVPSTDLAQNADHKTEIDKALLEAKEEAIEALDPAYESFIADLDADDHVTHFKYPHTHWPEKVKSVRLDKQPIFSGRLAAVKGQYLMLESGEVFNVRSHAGYRIRWMFEG
jgi:hypothetical protein